MMTSKRLLAVAVSAALYAPLSAFATNGMNMSGYGPIATAMGGASMAYDNGTAAMMNNPATLSMMDAGNRLDVAFAALNPDVEVSAMGGMAKWQSQADAFYMPAVGWAHKSGSLTYGAGMFAQGGMGSEYNAASPGAAFTAKEAQAGGATLATLGTLSSWDEMSQVGVMRVLFPVGFQVNNKLHVGGSIDFVRATMDVRMVMPGSMMGAMMAPGGSDKGVISNTMVDAMMGMYDPATDVIYGGKFDFADSNDFSGQTEGNGFAGKLGFTYKATDKMTIGGTYHSKTSLGDLEGDATVSMAFNMVAMGGTDMILPVNGKIKVVDFQWPATYALGFAYQESDKLMVVADVKRILWADAMESLNLSFTASGNTGPAAAFDGKVMDATMYQKWKDQTVAQAGLAYKATDAITARVGVNFASNPIPEANTHYLFPAIVKDHYNFGFGYMINKASDVNFSYTIVPVESVSTMGGMMDISHEQSSWQLMYSNRF